jgi:dolichol-phosphate mannosyltransferase
MKIAVVVPTYNERENISPLLARVFGQQTKTRHDLHVLVVDDDSPDRTADVVRDLQRTESRLHLLTGRKEGLGRAYVRGMAYALDTLQADAVVQMDGDLSHDPDDLPRLFAEIDAGQTFVIGSRYVAGGSIPDNWGAIRRANSAYGNVMARYVAGMAQVHDCTAGFRCIRATVLRRIGVESIRANGYCFQIELLHRALKQGARVKEVPVHFVDRVKGSSKLGLSDVLEFLATVWRLRLGNAATFAAFCLVGLTGVAVNLGILWLLLRAGLNRYVASPIAVQASIVTNFLLNNAWTFRRRSQRSTSVTALRFNVVSLVALSVSYSVFVGLSLTTSLSSLVAQAIGIVPATLVNYFLNVYWTWKA